jgi:hypothetical protein
MKTIVYDLLLTEVWKEKVYEKIKDRLPQALSIKQYMSVSSLLKTKLARSFTKPQC